MKIAITGHTRGIGKACADLLGKEHNIVGLSKSTGYDINNTNKVIMRVNPCDVFINNAYSGVQQSELFVRLFKIWENEPNKTIVNINSRSKYLANGGSGMYTADKKHLDHASEAMALRNQFKKCRVININPGYVDTDMIPDDARQYDILTPQKLAETIKWCLDQPQDIEIYELSIWKTSLK